MAKRTLLDDVAFLEEYADMFVTHWMEDDGNDAAGRAACQKTSDDITAAADRVRKVLALVDKLAKDHPHWADFHGVVAT